MEALAMMKKVRVKGRVKIEEAMVSEAFKLKRVNIFEEEGKPAASNRVLKRLCIRFKSDDDDDEEDWTTA